MYFRNLIGDVFNGWEIHITLKHIKNDFEELIFGFFLTILLLFDLSKETWILFGNSYKVWNTLDSYSVFLSNIRHHVQTNYDWIHNFNLLSYRKISSLTNTLSPTNRNWVTIFRRFDLTFFLKRVWTSPSHFSSLLIGIMLGI